MVIQIKSFNKNPVTCRTIEALPLLHLCFSVNDRPKDLNMAEYSTFLLLLL